MKIATVLCAILGAFYANAQEEVLRLEYTPIEIYQKNNRLKSSSTSPSAPLVALPFYEDFASTAPFANEQRWLPSDVFINDCFATRPPSIGVATFDALDKKGHLHSSASSSVFFADTLTSRPIALAGLSPQKNKPSDSIALSFYYQRGVLNYLDNTPDEKDSLFLEAYYPSGRYGVFINEISDKGIEIYNSTFEPTAIEGCFISIGTDSSRNVFRIKNHISDSLNPYYHTVLTEETLFNANIIFKVNPGDTIFFSDKTNKVVDSVIYANSAPTFNSYGRTIDGDALFVEFSLPTMNAPNGQWERIWSLGGNKSNPVGNDAFAYHRIFFKDVSQIVNGFRFRFLNSASLSNDPSHARNTDFFHIDHIYIGSRIGNTLDYPDVAFATPLVPFLREYTAVPYKHLSARGSTNDVSTFFFNVNNFAKIDRTVKYSISIQKQYGTMGTVTKNMYDAGVPAEAVLADTLNIRQYFNPFDAFLEDTDSRDEAAFDIKMFFADDNTDAHAPYRYNDTLRHTQNFSNFYAYDDGTSEAGYGVRGENMMAVSQKFKIYTPDTLRAVAMYFNPTLNDPDMVAKRFFLAIWNDNAGKPGDLIYKSPTIEAINNSLDGLNTFQTILLSQEGIISGESYLIVNGDIHIGWIQTSDFLMSIGVDLNRNTANKIHYQFGEKWTLAQTKFPLMIRPYLGKYFVPTNSDRPRHQQTECNIYPNPANNTFNISGSNFRSVHIYSLVGTKVLSTDLPYNPIDISELPEGVYFIKINTDNNSVHTEKLYIKR